MLSRYKQKEKPLRKFIEKHFKPQVNEWMKFLLSYKNRTIANLFVINKPLRRIPEQMGHVVYRYTCKAESVTPLKYMSVRHGCRLMCRTALSKTTVWTNISVGYMRRKFSSMPMSYTQYKTARNLFLPKPCW